MDFWKIMIGIVLGRWSVVWICKLVVFKFVLSYRMVSIDFNEEKGYLVIIKMGERMSLNFLWEIELKVFIFFNNKFGKILINFDLL